MDLFDLFKSFAFKNDPEKIHDLSLKMFEKMPQLSRLLSRAKPSQKYQLNDGHMRWNFPIGLAAGFDKNAQAINFFSRCGFGAVEVGTVTKLAQTGNPLPRIWRHPDIKSIRNAMGFPSLGAIQVKNNIIESPYDCCLGVNIGKNKETSMGNTPLEYAYLYEYFATLSDYIVINISSPNTPGLRDLQTKNAFRTICEALEDKRKEKSVPLYLKIAPDLTQNDIFDLIDLAKEFHFAGIIATNTTVQHNYGPGGLSGQYLKQLSKRVRKTVCQAAKEDSKLSVVGVGGIDSFEEILEFWKDGGSFVQIYSSFIYEGPALLQRMQRQIDQLLRREKMNSLQEYIDSIKEPH